MSDADHLAVYDVNTIANSDPSIIAYLDAPIRSAYKKTSGRSVSLRLRIGILRKNEGVSQHVCSLAARTLIIRKKSNQEMVCISFPSEFA